MSVLPYPGGRRTQLDLHKEEEAVRKIAIVGAGQAGMVLAFGLLKEGYEVTVFEGRPADEIEKGAIFGTAMVFDRQLNVERRLGLHEWEGQAPVCNGMHSTLRLPNGEIILQVQGGLDETCQGVDGRLKTSTWLRSRACAGISGASTSRCKAGRRSRGGWD